MFSFADFFGPAPKTDNAAPKTDNDASNKDKKDDDGGD